MKRQKRRRNLRSQRLDGEKGSGRRIKTSHVMRIAAIVAVMMGVLFVSRWLKLGPDSTHLGRANVGEPADFEAISDSLMIPRLETTSWKELDDPSRDGWDSEIFSAKATEQLERLAGWLTDGNEKVADILLSLATDGFRCGPLRPGNLVTVYQDAAVHVERAESQLTASPNFFHESAGLAAAASSLRGPLQGARNVRAKFKLYRVKFSPDAVTTRQHFEMSGQHDNGAMEMHATWTMRWQQDEVEDVPRITSIDVHNFEQVTTKGRTLFSDCTESVLASNPCYRAQLLRGFDHWLQRSQDHRFIFLLGNPGISIGDTNGDGLDDLYVCQEAGLPNRLFLQKPDGTAEDVSERAGVNWLDNSKCALLADLDNDGDQDLIVALNGGVALAANDGQASFTLRAILDSSDDVMSLAAADYNRDGRLDLYVGVYHRGASAGQQQEAAIPVAAGGVVYHDANNAGANSLFRNDTPNADSWRFTEVTRQVGLDENNRRFTLAAAWEDFDNDGDQDLYVANDFGRNNLYRNDTMDDGRSRFVDIAASAAAEDSASGMSVTWGDYDRDGWMDVYVSNMFSAAGNRVTFQQQFKPDAPATVKTRLQRFARGNTLLRNAGNEVFADVSDVTGVTMGRWAWGSNFTDLNNDGWDDLIVANGYITTGDSGDL